jgi:hypothetical protein
MKTTSVGGSESRERLGVIALGVLILVTVSAYLALRSSALESTGSPADLMPYQTLARDLVSSDQIVFTGLQQTLIRVEGERATASKWPDANTLGATGSPSYTWTASRQGFFMNYLARPATDAAGTAWLLLIQEPDPLATSDPAPNDETHHRLPDGTVLHVGIWMHRFGGQVPPSFVRQPEVAGWTQVLVAPVAPVAPARR